MHLPEQLHVTELADGWKGIYTPFSHGIAFLFDEAWDDLKKGNLKAIDKGMLDYLAQNHILVEPDFERRWIENNKDSSLVRFTSMFLVATQDCNFGCKYCAVIENMDGPHRMKEKMSVQTGRQAVNLFARHLEATTPADTRVTFYGGEPLLNQELIFDLVPRIRAIRYPGQHKPVEIIVITNGYLFNPELATLLKDNGAGVCISLDGTKRHQDVTRLVRGSTESTFDRVMHHFNQYKEKGISLGISTALGNHNAFDLEEICEFYASLEIPFVEFQIPYQVAKESNAFWVGTADISQRLMDAYAQLNERGVIEGTTYRRLRDFSLKQVRKRDCGASGSQLVVAPDGSVGPCHSLVGTRAFFDGNVADCACDPATMGNFTEWASRYPFNMAMCHACPYIALCGGGCIYNSYVTTQDIWNKDPQVCAYMKEMVDWILRDLWHESGMAARVEKEMSVNHPSCRGI